MRKTKIICTIGPASENEEVLTQMCLAGMNVARLNFSHGTHPEHQKKIDLIKKVREKLNLPIAIMLDTKGPEYRIGTFAEGSVNLEDGQTFTFTTDEVEGDQTRVSVNYKDLIKNLSLGDRILVNNGLVICEVTELTGNDAVCRVIVGGTLSNRKSMCFPNKVMTGPYLSEQDKSDILFGIQNDVDFVAASFASTRANIRSAAARFCPIDNDRFRCRIARRNSSLVIKSCCFSRNPAAFLLLFRKQWLSLRRKQTVRSAATGSRRNPRANIRNLQKTHKPIQLQKSSL